MVRVALVDKGRYASSTREVVKRLKRAGVHLVKKNPDVVVALGGDGTFLIAERKYPCVPKVAVRDSEGCYVCSDANMSVLLRALENGHFKKRAYLKLSVDGREAVNDVIIRNTVQQQALRFKVKVNGRDVSGECIGDGVVIATPFGSSAYFYSITRKRFRRGMGVAFNNTTRNIPPLFLSENARVVVEVLRGVARVSTDNDPRVREYGPGSRITVRKARQGVAVIKL